MHFIPQELDDYVVAHSQKEPELLQKLTRETYQKILQPRMLSGAFQGRILSMISKLINPKNILEIGCGSGQVFKYISWHIDKYHALDFSLSMCKLHPQNERINILCYDFDTEEFRDFLRDKTFDTIISSSAMQWSKDLPKLVETLHKSTSEINAVLFTSNTFKTIQKLTRKKSPILSKEEIKDGFSRYFNCEFETIMYKLEFDNKKDLFDYIKKSGVSGGSNSLDFKNAKKLYKEYNFAIPRQILKKHTN